MSCSHPAIAPAGILILEEAVKHFTEPQPPTGFKCLNPLYIVGHCTDNYVDDINAPHWCGDGISLM